MIALKPDKYVSSPSELTKLEPERVPTPSQLKLVVVELVAGSYPAEETRQRQVYNVAELAQWLVEPRQVVVK